MKRLSEPALRIRARSLEMGSDSSVLEMVGHSPAFLSTLAKLEKIARYREPVLITGESGLGKERSPRRSICSASPKGQPVRLA